MNDKQNGFYGRGSIGVPSIKSVVRRIGGWKSLSGEDWWR